MEDKKQLIVTHIKERIETTKELDKMYSEEKINKLAENLLTTNKPLQDIYTLIDNKFSH
jgi:hypothetical protein